MDILQEQVNILSTKVDALSQRIEQLSAKMSEVVVECKFGVEQVQYVENGGNISYRSQLGVSSLDGSKDHKDILVESGSLDAGIQASEKQLGPEIQIQRLTAQLTAAYNRIAALEEQLLSRRMLH